METKREGLVKLMVSEEVELNGVEYTLLRPKSLPILCVRRENLSAVRKALRKRGVRVIRPYQYCQASDWLH